MSSLEHLTSTSQRLLERLIADPVARAEFRRDPVATCRVLGFEDLVEHLAAARGVDTLELRESQSSLVGVLMAVVAESVSFAEIDGLLGHGGHGQAGADPSALRSGHRLEPPHGALPTPRSAMPVPLRNGGHALMPARDAAAGVAVAGHGASADHAASGDASGHAAAAAGGNNAAAASGSSGAAAGDLTTTQGGAAAVNASGTGRAAASGGGSGPAGVAELLSSSQVSMSAATRAWLAGGAADPRLVSVLDAAAARHAIVIGSIESVSDPVPAQAVDIVAVDGQPVGPGNVAARDLATEIARIGAGTRPSEVGTPWPIGSAGFVDDPAHPARLHLVFLSTPGAQSSVSSDSSSSGSPAVPEGGVAEAADAATHAGPRAATPADEGAARAVVAGLQAGAAAVAAANAQAQAALVGAGSQSAEARAPVAEVIAPGAGSGPVATPGSVDPRLASMLREANSLIGKPYVFGGGHGSFAPSAGYDCSGFVSAVLHAGGFLSQPADTTSLPDQPGILSGPGRWVTIYDRALPGDQGHVIIEMNGQFYESGGEHGPWGGGGGVERIARPSAAYLAQFPNVLHPEGL